MDARKRESGAERGDARRRHDAPGATVSGPSAVEALVAGARARLGEVPAYRPGSGGQGSWGKLSSNESPFGPAPAVIDALTRVASGIGRYPIEGEVRERVAAEVGVAPSQVLLTNGSDELCYLLGQLTFGSGGSAVLGDPCYLIDATATNLAGGALVKVPLVHGRHDLQAMAAAAADAALVWLPSPHNPTGAACFPHELEDFLAAVPPTCLVVLDEAYHAYLEESRRPESVRLCSAYPNLLVQRTFSKDYGLAGLRVGYCIGDAGAIAALAGARPPFSVNSLALAAVVAALEASEWQQMVVARTIAGRRALEGELEALGFEYYPSEANFVAARIPHGEIAGPAARGGLALRAGEDFGLAGWTRMTIGWEPEQAVLRAALREVAGARTES